MKYYVIYHGVLAIALITSPLTKAADGLLDVYKKALTEDLQFQSAQQSTIISRANAQMAKSVLYPQLSLSGQYINSNTGTKVDDIGFDNNSTSSYQYGVRLTQPLFDMSKWYGYQRGKLDDVRADLNTLQAKQLLISQVSSLYFNVLSGEIDVKGAKSNYQSIKQLYERAQRQFNVGDIAATNVNDALARLDQASLAVLAAESALHREQENLAIMLGTPIPTLKKLSDDYQILPPESGVERWVETAKTGNLSLQSAALDVKTAEYNAKAIKYKNTPKLSLSANYTDSHVNEGQNIIDRGAYAELSINIPIFDGGYNKAEQQRSKANLSKQTFALTLFKRQLASKVRVAYNDILTSATSVKTRKNAINSARQALRTTTLGIEEGSRTVVDILNAQRTLYLAETSYETARFKHIEKLFALKQLAGNLSGADIEALNQWFVEP